MINRRKIVLSISITAILAAAIGLFVAFYEENRFTERQHNRLKVGMTKDEVIRLLRCPPGDYTNGKGSYLLLGSTGATMDRMDLGPGPGELRDWWCGSHGAIWAHFDDDGRLTGSMYWHARETPPNIWTRLRRWLNL